MYVVNNQTETSTIEKKHKKDILKISGSQTVLVTNDFHCIAKKTTNDTFLKMSPFMFHRKKKVKQVWKNMRVHK